MWLRNSARKFFGSLKGQGARIWAPVCESFAGLWEGSDDVVAGDRFT
jgi:hypothetical protein